MKIATNTVVSIDYVLKDDDGQIIAESDVGEPLIYLHGSGQLVVGLEHALEGRQVGDEVQVAVGPQDGYGDRDEGLVQVVPRERLSGVEDLELGMQFRVESNVGPMVVTVVEIDRDTVTVDGNHPLAGLNLNFAVTVREIREATSEEIEHGHAHGPGGHSH